MDEDEAARKLQGLFRSRVARKQIQLLAKLTFERIYDEGSGAYFFYNTKTGESSWEKPQLMKDAEIKKEAPSAGGAPEEGLA